MSLFTTHNTSSFWSWFSTTMLLLVTTGCLDISDPVQIGSMCNASKATDECPELEILERPSTLGRNSLDFTLTNTSSVAVTAELEIELFDAFDFELDINMGMIPVVGPSADPDCELCAVRIIDLQPGEQVKGRFIPQELGREPRLVMSLFCAPEPDCALTLKYVLITEQNECVITEECSSGWKCDVPRGQCVECLTVNDCIEGQECELGRCTPPQITDCSTTRTHRPQDDTPLTLAVILVFLGILYKRRRKPRLHRGAGFLLTGAFVLVLFVPDFATAQDNLRTATKVETSLEANVGPRFFFGPIGERTRRGLGLGVSEQLRWGWIGGALQLNASYFVTTHEMLPLSRELLTYSVHVGPRFFIDLPYDISTVLFVGYDRLGFASNSLVELTGTELSYHAASAGVGIKWRWNPVELGISGSYLMALALPGGLMSLNVSVGIIGD